MTIQVDPTVSPRIITVPETDGVSITIQSLVNQIRTWEDNQANLSYAKLLSASGKEDLGSSTLVGITAKLENTKLKFEARGTLTTCYVGGGNLVAVDIYGNSMFPIEPSTNVTVQLTQSSSATLLETGVSGLTAEESQALLQIQDVKAKTDFIPTHPASEGEYNSVIETIRAKTDTIVWTDVELVKQIETGAWKVLNNQMIFYGSDGLPLRTFDLKNATGQPAMKDVYERVPV